MKKFFTQNDFTEFYSNVYYKEDIATLINLIDYTADDVVQDSSVIKIFIKEERI